MTATTVVRPARADDLPALIALLKLAELPVADLQAPAAVSPTDFFVALSAGRIVGGVGLERHGGAGLLRSLVVSPEARGRGLGSTLLGAVETHARRSGLLSLTLLTQSAVAFFERHGYAAVDRSLAPAEVLASEQFTRLCPSDSICMMRPLSAQTPR